MLMEYKSPSLGLQLTEALSDENLADVTVGRIRATYAAMRSYLLDSLYKDS